MHMFAIKLFIHLMFLQHIYDKIFLLLIIKNLPSRHLLFKNIYFACYTHIIKTLVTLDV